AWSPAAAGAGSRRRRWPWRGPRRARRRQLCLQPPSSRAPREGSLFGFFLYFRSQHLPQHILQNPAVTIVRNFFRSIHACRSSKSLFFAIGSLSAHGDRRTWRQRRYAFNIKNFMPRQPKGFVILPRLEFQRQHAHTDQIAAMNAL